MSQPFRACLRPALATVTTLGILAAAAPALAQPRRDDRGFHDDRGDHRHYRDWHRHWGYGGGYYPPPPVVYSPPYYAPPPVVYGPGLGVNIRIP